MSRSSFPALGGGRRKAAIAAALLGLITTPLALGFSAPAQANAAGTALVISEVYGGGGNSGAQFKNDFIELFNPTNSAVTMTNWSVQYASGTGTSWAVTSISGTVPAHGYFLVQQAAGTGTTMADLPTPDATGTIAMSGTAGKVLLRTNNTAMTGVATGNVNSQSLSGVIDFVGFGTATSFEGSAATPAPSNTASAARTPEPGTDTDANGTDFAAGVPTPKNSTSRFPEPVAPKLVISEAFSHGDIAGDFGEDFVEVFNAGTAVAALDEVTLKIDGAEDELSGTLASGAYLVLPRTLGDANGSVELIWENNSSSIDLVGWGTGTHEGAVAAPAGSATESAQRNEDNADTGNNGADFLASTPTRAAAYAPPPAPEFTIAEIQGTGNTSGMQGNRVRTRGVVTGAYPGSTGLSGFYLQTAGEEGVDYATPGASDAIFVSTGSRSTPAVGASVEVTGVVEESFGLTRLLTVRDSQVVSIAALPPVVPTEQLPAADCAEGACLTGTALAAAREEFEGEAFLPTAPYTVTDSYDGGATSSSNYGEFVLAANSSDPLYIPVELARPGSARATAIAEYNAAHQVVLDDGSSVNYTSNSGQAFPWMTLDNTVRAGAGVTFVQPVVLDYQFGVWRLQPTERIPSGNDGGDWVAFDQDRPAQPDEVGGDLTIATFNMLNYFNTLGEDYAASDGNATGSPGSSYNFTNPRRCNYYNDRAGVRLTNNTCDQDSVDPLTGLNVKLPGPRGAATAASFARQEAKILAAINTMDADVVSLEEIENSLKLYDGALSNQTPDDADRDDAIDRLVTELNAAWATAYPAHEGPRWAYVPSPRREAQPTVTEQDAIRSGFIYDPSKVEAAGRSRILTNAPAMRNAREPLAQAFKPLGGGRADRFAVIVNHFKSKGGPQAPFTVTGDNVDTGDGAGFYNGDRKRQAAALVAFADQFASDRNIGPVFLTGDFNAYSKEDPVGVITDAGYADLHADNGETTYFFGGLAGSLDHVFANDSALEMVTGQTVWPINANEPVYYEYSRFNYNITNLYDTSPFRSSDHNPEIIGIETGVLTPDPDLDVVQVLGINDFHGRILSTEGGPEAGAASLAGAVKELREENPDTVFAAAGDLIGASTFESFIANDKPTIDALNEAGLEVSAAGNHEFDQGYDDLVDRVMAEYDADTNPEGGAEWEYIAGNVRFRHTQDGHVAGDPALPETWFAEFGDRSVGFVGAVTEDLPALVAAGGIAEIVVTDIVDAVNDNAADLRAPGGCESVDGCDLVVMLVHEGAATPSYTSVTNGSTFAQIVGGASADIDAIISGHTHLAYNHKVPVQQWIDEEREVTKRPVVSAGQYGANLNRLEFEFEPDTDNLVNVRQTVLNLNDYDADPDTEVIVEAAADAAAAEGNVALGDLEGSFKRARRTDTLSSPPTVENRGGESTLGNLVAEIQRWQTASDIAFMNPGGLRADMLGLDGNPRVLTYRQAADVQPFANTLVAMDLTGAQIKTILEQQWQRDADGNIPSRPFLRLGTSDGLVVTEDASRSEGDRVTGIWLDGEPLGEGETYRVVANSFLASGTGDNFWGFADATQKQDTGKTDLQGVVEYMEEFASATPLPVDYRQHAVGVLFSGGAPATYVAGDTLAFGLSSLAMTGADDRQDTQVEVLLGDTVIGGPFAVTNTMPNHPDYDAAGTASVSVQVPEVGDGGTEFTVRGLTTGTEVPILVQTSDGLPDATVSGADVSYAYGQTGTLEIAVDPTDATGGVQVYDGDTLLGAATLDEGAAEFTLSDLEVGEHQLTLVYPSDGVYSGDTGSVTVTVTKATAEVAATPSPLSVVKNVGTSSVSVIVSASGVDPEGEVTASVNGDVVDTATLSDGAASLVVGPFSTAGTKTITVDYLGDDHTRTGSTTTTVTVTDPAPGPGPDPTPVVVDTSTAATAAPMVYGTPGSVSVKVTSTKPTSGGVQLLNGSTVLASGTPSASGTATLSVPGAALAVGSHNLTVKYLGDSGTKPSQGTVTVVVEQAESATNASVTPSRVVVGQGITTVRASVSAAGFTPTGTVEIYVDGVRATTRVLTNGSALVELPAFTTVGDRSITVKYVGDANATASDATAGTVRVVKATPTMEVRQKPDRVVVDKTKAKVVVVLAATGHEVSGDVTIKWDGRQRTETLRGERAVFRLPRFDTRGVHDVKVVYRGSDLAEKVVRTIEIKVVKNKKRK